MEANDILNVAIAYYKDKVQSELLEKFRQQTILLMQADADARRKKSKETILAMARLKVELTKFKLSYGQLCRETGPIPGIDDYVKNIETQVKLLSLAKNRR